MKFIRKLLIGAIVALGLCLSGGAAAGEAVDFVKPRLEKLIRTTPGGFTARKISAELFDSDTIARGCLGDLRSGVGEDLWTRFRLAVVGVIQRELWTTVYPLRDHEIRYVGEEFLEEGRGAVVTIWAENRKNRNDRTFAEFLMLKDAEGKYRVVDIHFEMISMVGSWRTRFKAAIKHDGFTGFVQRLEFLNREVEPDRSGAGR